MHYHIPNCGPSLPALITAARKAAGLALHQAPKEILLRVNTMDVLDGPIAQMLGPSLLKTLKSTKRLALQQDVHVLLETDATRTTFASGVILALYLTPKSIDRVLADPRATDIILVPQCDADLRHYLAKVPTSTPL